MTVMGANVVDYNAWNRGYTPPSEHVLIDQLAYRGARVVLASDWGEKHGAVWVVVRGDKITPKMRKAMRAMLDIFVDEQVESLGTGSESAPGPAQCKTNSAVEKSSG